MNIDNIDKAEELFKKLKNLIQYKENINNRKNHGITYKKYWIDFTFGNGNNKLHIPLSDKQKEDLINQSLEYLDSEIQIVEKQIELL